MFQLRACQLDLDAAMARWPDRTVALGSSEVALLKALMDREGKDVPVDELGRVLADDGHTLSEPSIARAVARLRSKIERDPRSPDHLLTSRTTGYRFVAQRPGAWREVGGGLRVDLLRHEIERDGVPIRLTSQDARVLQVLLDAEGQVVLRADMAKLALGARVATRTLDVALTRLRRKLEPDAERPRWLVTERGEGWRLVPGGRLGADRHFPRYDDAFIGRSDAAVQITAGLGPGALVTVVGIGGSGKTRLAVEVARRLAQQGVELAFVDLTVALDEAGVARRTADALGIEVTDRDLARQVGLSLGARGRVLVVLDSAEGVSGPLARLLDGWRAQAAETSFLVTSLVALHARGEEVVVVEGLPPAEATELLRTRAPQGWGEEDGATSLESIVVQLEGLPLAIELAGARGRVLSPTELGSRMTDRLRLLEAPWGDRPERHKSLRAVLDVSWNLLGDSSRATLSVLAFLRAPFDLDAAEALVGDTALDDLDVLVGHHLVARKGSRFRMPEIVRAYAKEHPSPEGIAERHGEWFARWGSSDALASLRGRDRRRLLERLRAELDDVQAAWERAVLERDLAKSKPLTRALVALFTANGAWEQLVAVVDAALPLFDDPGEKAELVLGEAIAHGALRGTPVGAARMEHCIDLAREAGDAALIATARCRLAFWFATSERLQAAEEALADAPPQAIDPMTWLHVSWAWLTAGDAVRSGVALEPARRAAMDRGDHWALCWVATQQVRLRMWNEDGPALAEAIEHTIEEVRGLGGARILEPTLLDFLGEANRERDPARAERAYEEALQLALELGRPLLAIAVLCELGDHCLESGETVRARQHLEHAERLETYPLPHLDILRAGVLLEEGKLLDALGQVDRATGVYGERNFARERSLALLLRARILLALGRRTEAETMLQQAKDHAVPMALRVRKTLARLEASLDAGTRPIS